MKKYVWPGLLILVGVALMASQKATGIGMLLFIVGIVWSAKVGILPNLGAPTKEEVEAKKARVYGTKRNEIVPDEELRWHPKTCPCPGCKRKKAKSDRS